MPHWMALLPAAPSAPCQGDDAYGPDNAAAAVTDIATTEPPAASPANVPLPAEALAWWALQFTPRVTLLAEAVLLEVQGSERLFGGQQMLAQRVVHEARRMGVQAWAQANTALAALALSRHHLAQQAPLPAPLDEAHPPHDDASRLDRLPLHVLPGVAEHHPTLARLGCHTLGDVRRLPRAGLSRRFGAPLLRALDQAYGLVPEAFEWVELPPAFEARLELPGRVESAPALLFAAQRLLAQLCAWLAGRQAGVTTFTLSWLHDWHRRDTSPEGRHTVRLASPTRDAQRLGRLLSEHLQHIMLAAPVGDIALHADEIAPLPQDTAALFQEHDAQQGLDPLALLTPAGRRRQHDALLTLLDRLGARLGPEHVLQARIVPDHRLECAQVWLPAVEALTQMHPASANKEGDDATHIAPWPQPTWILPHPLPLALAREGPGLRERPIYRGQLTLLAGPHRIEAGWWDGQPLGGALVTRDYYLASSERAGLLWIFRARHAPDDGQRSPWYLHGFFA